MYLKISTHQRGAFYNFRVCACVCGWACACVNVCVCVCAWVHMLFMSVSAPKAIYNWLNGFHMSYISLVKQVPPL